MPKPISDTSDLQTNLNPVFEKLARRQFTTEYRFASWQKPISASMVSSVKLPGARKLPGDTESVMTYPLY